MKNFAHLFLFLSFFVINMLSVAFAQMQETPMSAAKAEQLLKQKKIELIKFQNDAFKIHFGEVSGAGKSVQFDKVQVVFTKEEAILKKEIQFVDFAGKETLEHVEGIHFQGQFIAKDLLKGVIYKK